jgi:hypothetical protein
MKAKTLVLDIVLMLGVLLPGFFALAAAPTPNFALVSFQHHADGPDRVFELEVKNVTDQSADLRGRFVTISVYDTTQPTVMPIEDVQVAPHATQHLEIRWVGAPLAGRVRALLVLSGGTGPSYVQPFDFWLLPFDALVWAIGIILLAVLAVVVMRLCRGRKHHEHIPANMTGYRVEFDDTVMTISNRYGVVWQDLVKANRLKPPYDLKPGQRLLIPRHPLTRPPETNKTV